MTAAIRRWLPFAAGLLVTACSGAIGVLATNQEQVRVPHSRHKQADVDCATCHETIFDSQAVDGTPDLPKEKVCLGCHKEEKVEKNNCAFCHTKQEPSTYAGRTRWVKFNHALHMEPTKEDCAVCHQALPNPYWTEQVRPAMSTCLGCHEHQAQYDKGNCDVCHKDLTVYQLRPVSDYSHRGDWTANHRLEARSTDANCSMCHEQTFCSQCHAQTVAARPEFIMPERVDRNFIHRNDFISRHAIEARADEARCQRCHGIDSCQGCHAKNGLSPQDPGVDPHPAGFGEGSVHGPAARRDIVSCAACHDQGAASNCVSCHKVGGIAGNPHPPSWTVRHGREEIGRDAMCQVCHQ